MMKKFFFCILFLLSFFLFGESSSSYTMDYTSYLKDYTTHTYSYPKMDGYEDLQKLLPDLPYDDLHSTSRGALTFLVSYTDLIPADMRLLIFCEKSLFDNGEIYNTKMKICKDLSTKLGYFGYKEAQKPRISFRKGQNNSSWVTYEFQVLLYK